MFEMIAISVVEADITGLKDSEFEFFYKEECS
jgi:hypothetical protein